MLSLNQTFDHELIKILLKDKLIKIRLQDDIIIINIMPNPNGCPYTSDHIDSFVHRDRGSLETGNHTGYCGNLKDTDRIYRCKCCYKKGYRWNNP